MDGGGIVARMFGARCSNPNSGVYSPRNFSESYSGAIEADKGLGKVSLNIPAVRFVAILWTWKKF